MRVEVIRAWPRHHESVALELPEAATVADTVIMSGFEPAAIGGYAVFGERVTVDTLLRDGDRLELLQALQADPKDARRRRASKSS